MSSSLACSSSTTVPLPARQDTVDESSVLSNAQELHALKRHLAALEAENALMHSRMVRKPVQTLANEARGIRRLVTLVEPVTDMIAEHDRRQLRLRSEDGVTPVIIQTESTPNQNRTFKNFQKLRAWCPMVAKLLDLGQFDVYMCREAQSSADGARGDDTSTLKKEVIPWITDGNPHVDPPLTSHDKECRGLNHMITGRLICPVEYDWADASVRAHIRDNHPDFCITAYSWPLFLYKDNAYSSDFPALGLFKNDLLVLAFKCIFTSPSSARRDPEKPSVATSPSARNVSKGAKPPKRQHVAEILHMKNVQPRAIAYTAVQLRFALSSAPSWAVEDDEFDYEAFFYNIVEYFEAPNSPGKENEIKDLLSWWNQAVFGRRNASASRPLHPETLSVARSRK